MTLERFHEITRAIERAFPDRAELILSCLVERLPPGPWDETRPPTEEIGATDYDELRIETHRALRAHCEDGEHAVSELDDALRAAVVERFTAILAFRSLQSPGLEDPADWACDALSQGFDGTAVRELAGLRGENAWELDRVFAGVRRELAIELAPAPMFRALVRAAAKQFARGRMSESGWSRVLYAMANVEPARRSLRGLDLYILFRWEDELDEVDAEIRRQVAAVLRGELPA